jgi:hypothetical protein
MASILLVVQAVSFTWSWSLYRKLKNKDGGALARFLAISATALLFAQILALIRAVLISHDAGATLELRVILFIVEETTLVTVNAFVMFGASKLKR